MRLDKFLANENIGSRKEVGILVRKGAVTVNGQAVKTADVQIDAEKDEVCVNGKPVRYNAFVYLLMNKPSGVLTATRDNRAKTVLDLIPAELKRKDLFPAGRLDKDTTGLMILTNNGPLAHRVLSPKQHVPKIYRFTAAEPMADGVEEKFRDGVTLADGY